MIEIKTLTDINEILTEHDTWRGHCLNIIASENVASPAVRRFLTCDFGGRYPTYYDDPAQRNYFGNRFMAELEIAAQNLAKKVYDATYVDFRPLGGEMAGNAVILGLVNAGDTILETGNCFGGQKVASKLITANALQDLLHVEYIPYDPNTHDIDVAALGDQMQRLKPKLIILGRAHILFPETLGPLRKLADEIGAYLAYDFSHINGLVAGKTFPNPLDFDFDVVMGSHHKSLPGPQGGLYFTRNEEIYRKIRRGLYPPLVTNHHLERVPALAATYLEMLEFGESYAQQIGKNSSALGRALYERGFNVLYPERAFSQSHQVLVDVELYGGGKETCKVLEAANIITGPGAIPKDLPTDGKMASGIRLGTQELTRIGMVESDMDAVAELLERAVMRSEDPQSVARDVADFVSQFKTLKFCFEEAAHPYEAIF
jgi:glycine hydroxymethyltransferase